MRHGKTTRYALLLVVGILAPVFLSSLIPQANAVTSYFLTPVPVLTQEGYTVTLVLTVVGALPTTQYQFVFAVKDPSGKTWNSTVQTHVTNVGETQFSVLVIYPSTSFVGRNSLCCQYNAQVNQLTPIPTTNVASTPFYIILTDAFEYERTQTVNIHGSGYNSSESVSVTIRTFTNPTVVFSQTVQATSSGTIGIVSTNWKIPKNAIIDQYIVTLTGTSTVKSTPDAQGFSVKAATMTITALASSKAAYQRTETMIFSFQPRYPDGSNANSGVALLTLARPSGGNVTLTATYDGISQTFNATYKTFVNNQTGTWTATLGSHAFGDGYGNTGPSVKLTNNPQLTPATLTINVSVNSYFPLGQPVRFNATISYPDGTTLQSGTVGAYLLYSGSPPVNNTFPPVIFDTGIQKWVGNYSPQPSDPGGLYSLVIKASDSPTPPNTGSATRAITLQDRPPVASFTASPVSAPTGTPIGFNGTSSYDPDGTIVTWSWTFGDTATGTGSTPSHTYSVAGTYTVGLTVTDNSGSTAVTSSSITITDRPPTVSSGPSTATPSPGQTVTLSITASDPDGTITSTRVDWGDGTVHNLGSVSTDSHIYNLTGSTTSQAYTITVTVTDNSGSMTTTTSQLTVTDAPPTISFTSSATTVNPGQTVTLSITASDPDGTISTMRIDWGDGKVQSWNFPIATGSHSYNLTGSTSSKTYTITVTVIDNRGQTNASSTQVVVQSSGGSGSGNVSLPLYYFGIFAAIIAAILAGIFLAFRRHKVTHAKLKIDLEAVRTEAGRIENQEFFQSVKDQLKKDKE